MIVLLSIHKKNFSLIITTVVFVNADKHAFEFIINGCDCVVSCFIWILIFLTSIAAVTHVTSNEKNKMRTRAVFVFSAMDHILN